MAPKPNETEHFSKEQAVYFLGHSREHAEGLVVINAGCFLKYFASNHINFAEGFIGYAGLNDAGDALFQKATLETQAEMHADTARKRYATGDIQRG